MKTLFKTLLILFTGALLLACEAEEVRPELQDFYGKFFVSELHTETYTTSGNDSPTYIVEYEQQKVLRFFADGTVEYFIVIPPIAVKDGFFRIGSFTERYPFISLYGLTYNEPIFRVQTDSTVLHFELDGLRYMETDAGFR